MHWLRWRTLAVCFAAVLAGAPARAAAPGVWTAAWGAAQQIPEARNALAPSDLDDATLRQTVHLTRGGDRLRLRLSNAYGTEPLLLDSVTVAWAPHAGTAQVVAATRWPVFFDGRRTVAIPAGAEYFSEPVDLPTEPFSNLSISIHFAKAPAQQTSHPGSRTTSFILAGEHTRDLDLPGARPVEHWFNLSGVDVEAANARTVVAFGDSITDGRGSTTNGDNRWPDRLATRLQASAATRGIGVVNAGIGGNRLLADGLGPSALARFDRDVLARPGARWVILLEGINDLGTLDDRRPEAHAELVRRVIGAYEQLIDRAHAGGLKIIGATLTPIAGSAYDKSDPLTEQDRQALNRWIRLSDRFDAVVDFDEAIRDPDRPDQMLPVFDDGDHLHPSVAGYAALAEAIPLSLFR